MIKFLFLLILISYVLSKLSGMFRASSGPQQNKNYQQRKPEGSIHVDTTPKKEKRGDIKGGDYVDYEEVK